MVQAYTKPNTNAATSITAAKVGRNHIRATATKPQPRPRNRPAWAFLSFTMPSTTLPIAWPAMQAEATTPERAATAGAESANEVQ